ncbi:MAG: PAS domain S-box protein [Thermoanaerobaculia bacterium]
MFDLSLDMLCVAGIDGYFKEVSPAFTLTLGWSRKELLSKPFFDFVHPDDVEPTAEVLQSLAEGEELVDFENRYRHLDGSYRWLQWRAAPREDIVYAVGRDVTERKQVEEELRQSELRYRLLVEDTNDIIYDADPDGCCTFSNAVAARLTGYQEEELRGMHYLELVHPDCREDAKQFYASQFSQRNSSTYYEFPIITHDGGVVWLGQTVHLVAKGDRVESFHAVARDITARKQAEEMTRALLHSASQAVVAIDRSGRIVFENPTAQEMFGYSSEDLRQLTIEALIPERLRDTHVAHRDSFLPKGGTRPMGIGLELIARRKDGTEFPVEVSLSSVETSEGQLAVSFVSDISERRRLEENIRQREKLTALADGLLQGQEEERSRVARRLHDTVSQELAMLSVEMGLLSREVPEEERSVRDEMARLRERIVQVSDGIRDLSHRLHPAELEELGLVSTLRSHADWLAKHEGIRVDLVVEKEPASIPSTIGLALYRVTQEALRNVVKHSGVEEAKVSLADADAGLRLSITDQGVGFDAERVSAHAGLGLVSMEERIRLLGGQLKITSMPEQGTKLEVFVPISREEE